VLARVRAGEEDPPCASCGGILKSDTISFGQPLVPAVIERAMCAASEADCLVAVGTSLQVYPIAAAVPAARSGGASLIIVNAEATPFDDLADVTLADSISDVLPELLTVPRE
jgi:NAD-dependent deacetylase